LLNQKALKHWVLFEIEFDEKAPAKRADREERLRSPKGLERITNKPAAQLGKEVNR
jgi:hypothetical protein